MKHKFGSSLQPTKTKRLHACARASRLGDYGDGKTINTITYVNL
jgi:hypothetical protein